MVIAYFYGKKVFQSYIKFCKVCFKLYLELLQSCRYIYKQKNIRDFSHTLSAFTRSKFGNGNGKFLLDEVNCFGNETSLLSCDSNPWKDHDCKDYEVAGVQCQQSKGQ